MSLSKALPGTSKTAKVSIKANIPKAWDPKPQLFKLERRA